MEPKDDTVSVVQKSPPPPESFELRPPQYPIESVDNALKIILLLGERKEIRLTEASEHLNVASSTAHRILAMLTWRGFVRQNAQTKAYGPGPALTNVAFSILRQMDIPRIVQPILEEISAALGETSHLGTLEGNQLRFLAVSEPTVAVRVASRLGKDLPAHCTSSGKALLAELTEEQLFRLYPDEVLPAVTEHSITSRTELQVILAKVRKSGYASNREESEDGVASVAVAIPSSAGIRFALNASAPVHRLPASKVPVFGHTLKDAAMRVAELIG